jgi:hypothetical protein
MDIKKSNSNTPAQSGKQSKLPYLAPAIKIHPLKPQIQNGEPNNMAESLVGAMS